MLLAQKQHRCRHKKVKAVVYSPDIYHCAFSTNFTIPLTRWAPVQPASIDPISICAPGTHYSYVGRGSVECEVCLTLLHMTSAGN